MDRYPPLLLLCDVSQVELRVKFGTFLSENENVFLDPLGRAGSSGYTILFNGLTLICESSDRPAGLRSCRRVFSSVSDDIVRSFVGVKLHPHLGDGLRLPEVAKQFLGFGALLAKGLGAVGVLWNPSKLLSDTSYFVETVEAYSNGGVFPVLPLVDFAFDGASNLLRSNGLDLFCGQEFELKANQFDRQEIIRRAIRLTHDLATNGAVEDAQDVPDIDPGHVIELVPSDDNALLHCRIKSKSDEIVTLS